METLFLALRVLVALGAILALIWFVQRKLTKTGGTKPAVASRFGGAKKAIQVHGTHRLGAKSSITVVEIDGVRMVLGVTEHGISVLEPAPQPHPVAPAAAQIPHPEAIVPESEPPVVPEEPEPVDFAAVFREALDEAAATPALATVTESTTEGEHVAPRRRRRYRVSIPALAEQLLPHMTRTLAGAIGLRVDARPAEAPPAAPRATPAPQPGALAAFLRNAGPEAPKKPLTKDYSTAEPLAAHLPVLQRVS